MKKIFIGVGILLIIFAIAVIIFNLPTAKHPEPTIIKMGKLNTINVEKITEGQSYIDSSGGQQYVSLMTVFGQEGWYRGKGFKNEYVEEGKTKMRISQNMVPGDGVIEGFVMETINNSEPYITVFVDSDWKQALPDTRIYYGKMFQNREDFIFSEISPGIYQMTVKEDKNRFEYNYSLHYGGMYVGDLRDDNQTTVIFFN